MLEKFINEGLRGKSGTTVKTYFHALQQFQTWLGGVDADLDTFGRVDVQQYIDYLASKKKSASTINKVFSAIKKFAKWDNRPETVEDISVVKAPDIKKQAPEGLSKVERNRLLRELDRAGNKRDYAITVTLLMTGLRASELVSLDKSDTTISERKGSVKVVGKGRKERVIPLNAEARRAITKYLEERSDSHPALFVSNRGERISVRSVQFLLGKHGVHPHQLRHTFITGLVRANEDISVIQSLSGHSSADMILRYSQPTEEDKQRAVDNMLFEYRKDGYYITDSILKNLEEKTVSKRV